jgi:hypothetical protein
MEFASSQQADVDGLERTGQELSHPEGGLHSILNFGSFNRIEVVTKQF